MAAATTVAQKLKLAVRPPLVPKPRLQAERAGSIRRPESPLNASRSSPEPQKRPVRVPPVPRASRLPYPRFEGAPVGAVDNELPRYMFKPGQTNQAGPFAQPRLPKPGR